MNTMFSKHFLERGGSKGRQPFQNSFRARLWRARGGFSGASPPVPPHLGTGYHV
jgi:hypothetical protein